MRHLILLLAVCLFGSVGTIGCKSLDLRKGDAETKEEELPWWKKDDQPPAQKPAKIVAIWSNSVFDEQGAPPIRGLGGRVYFYDAKHQPVRVDGKLTVFIYDDTHKNATEKQEATRQIDFSAEEVASKYTPSEFGASYSFWLPWDEVGGERAQLSVIPVFTTKDGQMLAGKQARYLLPGKRPTAIAEEDRRAGGVVAASYEDSAETRVRNGRARPTTIKLPRSVQQRLRESPRPIRPSDADRRATQEATEIGETHISVTTPQRNRKPAGSFGQRTTDLGSNASRLNSRLSRQSREGGRVIEASQQPSADSQPDLHQAQTLQSAQQASAHDPNLLDRARSLFGQ